MPLLQLVRPLKDARLPGRPWRAPDGAIGTIDLRALPQRAAAGDDPQGWMLASSKAPIEVPGTIFLGEGSDTLDTKTIDAFAEAMGFDASAETPAGLIEEILGIKSDPTGLLRPKPLMPANGFLEIHCGGVLVRRKFDASGADAAHFDKCLTVHKEDYRAIREASLQRGDEFYKKYLGGLVESYKELGIASAAFIPDDLPKETPVKPSTTFTESFNTADSDTLGPDLTWTELGEDWDIVSNLARKVSGSNAYGWARAEHDLSSADHYCQAKLYGNNLGSHGPTARFSASAVTGYSALHYSGSIYITAFVAGSPTNLTSTSQTFASGDTYKIHPIGSTVKAYVNGSEKLSVTDSSISGNVRFGIVGYDILGGSGGLAELDDVEASDGLGGGGGVFNPYYYRLLGAAA